MRDITKLVFGFLIFTLALLLGGCASSNPRPTPAQTKTPASTPQNDRYFVPTAPADVYSDPTADYANMGLESRNPNSNLAAATNNTAGSNPNAIAKIYFDFNKSGVSPDQRTKLQDVAAYMNQHTQLSSLIEGHCDWRGTVEYNLALGERRAKSVANYLINLGIAKHRIETRSKGDLESAVEGTKQEMVKDRRVDVIAIN